MEDVRSVPSVFPSVEVGGTGPRRGDLISGTEQFSGINALEQDVLEIHDDLSFLSGEHTHHARHPQRVLRHQELLRVEPLRLLLLPDARRARRRPSRASTRSASSRRPDRARSRSSPSSSTASTPATSGARRRTSPSPSACAPITPCFGDDPNFNPSALALFGIDTSQAPDDNLILAPRVGFNWDPESDGKSQLRGGVGLFAGRTPYVWVSNVYAGTGIGSQSLTARGRDPVQPRSLQSAALRGGRRARRSTPSTPHFEFPQVLARDARPTIASCTWWKLRGSARGSSTR